MSFQLFSRVSPEHPVQSSGFHQCIPEPVIRPMGQEAQLTPLFVRTAPYPFTYGRNAYQYVYIHFGVHYMLWGHKKEHRKQLFRPGILPESNARLIHVQPQSFLEWRVIRRVCGSTLLQSCDPFALIRSPVINAEWLVWIRVLFKDFPFQNGKQNGS